MRTPFDWYVNCENLTVEILEDIDEVRNKSEYFHTLRRGITPGREVDEEILLDVEKQLIAIVKPKSYFYGKGTLYCSKHFLVEKEGSSHYTHCCSWAVAVKWEKDGLTTWLTVLNAKCEPEYRC